MIKLTPLNDIVIVRLIENEAKTSGGIIITQASVAKSIKGEVMVANSLSYHRGGELRQPLVERGDIVVLQSSSVGTDVVESPKGERWIAVPEDCILYTVKGEKHD